MAKMSTKRLRKRMSQLLMHEAEPVLTSANGDMQTTEKNGLKIPKKPTVLVKELRDLCDEDGEPVYPAEDHEGHHVKKMEIWKRAIRRFSGKNDGADHPYPSTDEPLDHPPADLKPSASKGNLFSSLRKRSMNTLKRRKSSMEVNVSSTPVRMSEDVAPVMAVSPLNTTPALRVEIPSANMRNSPNKPKNQIHTPSVGDYCVSLQSGSESIRTDASKLGLPTTMRPSINVSELVMEERDWWKFSKPKRWLLHRAMKRDPARFRTLSPNTEYLYISNDMAPEDFPPNFLRSPRTTQISMEEANRMIELEEVRARAQALAWSNGSSLTKLSEAGCRYAVEANNRWSAIYELRFSDNRPEMDLPSHGIERTSPMSVPCQADFRPPIPVSVAMFPQRPGCPTSSTNQFTKPLAESEDLMAETKVISARKEAAMASLMNFYQQVSLWIEGKRPDLPELPAELKPSSPGGATPDPHTTKDESINVAKTPMQPLDRESCNCEEYSCCMNGTNRAMPENSRAMEECQKCKASTVSTDGKVAVPENDMSERRAPKRRKTNGDVRRRLHFPRIESLSSEQLQIQPEITKTPTATVDVN